MLLRGISGSCSRALAHQPRSLLLRQSVRSGSAAAARAPVPEESSPPPESTPKEATTGIPLDDGPSTSVPSPDREREISPRVRALVDQIAALSLLDVADLNWALKKRLNIPDTPAMGMMPMGMMAGMMAQGAAAQAGQEQPAEEAEPAKTSYAVKLTAFDAARKIELIKQVRDIIPGMNLVQAKKFVESAPVEVRGDMGKTEADELKARLDKAGGTCEVV